MQLTRIPARAFSWITHKKLKNLERIHMCPGIKHVIPPSSIPATDFMVEENCTCTFNWMILHLPGYEFSKICCLWCPISKARNFSALDPTLPCSSLLFKLLVPVTIWLGNRPLPPVSGGCSNYSQSASMVHKRIHSWMSEVPMAHLLWDPWLTAFIHSIPLTMTFHHITENHNCSALQGVWCHTTCPL